MAYRFPFDRNSVIVYDKMLNSNSDEVSVTVEAEWAGGTSPPDVPLDILIIIAGGAGVVVLVAVVVVIKRR
jgi:hypothetical protein